MRGKLRKTTVINIKQRIAVIEGLVERNNIQSLTYAALECRLTIEQICYERLLISHSYIARSDLKKWTPAQVVRQIAEEVNEDVASGFTLSISKEPSQKGNEPKHIADFQAKEYVKLGEQIGFKIRVLNSLWQGLSNVALHINVPEDLQSISMYGDIDAIKAKVAEAVAEFRRFEPGNLIMGSLSGANSFECIGCGSTIRRNADLLKEGQVISCFNPTCDESYTVQREAVEITYKRRLVPVNCKGCSTENFMLMKTAEKLRYRDVLTLICPDCHSTTFVRLALVQESAPTTAIDPQEAVAAPKGTK